MKRIIALMAAALALAAPTSAEDIGGKFAFGFEQGLGVGGDQARLLGRGVSFKLCLSNVIAIKAALGFNYSQKADEVRNIEENVVYSEEKDKVDYTAALYGVLVFRRFERVHLNGMTGLLIAFKDNHFKDEIKADENLNRSFAKSGETFTQTDIHLRILMAPEIFLFPNFSLEYKYGFDVAIKKDPIQVENPDVTGEYMLVERKRLYIDVVGDLDLLQSASVHFYF